MLFFFLKINIYNIYYCFLWQNVLLTSKTKSQILLKEVKFQVFTLNIPEFLCHPFVYCYSLLPFRNSKALISKSILLNSLSDVRLNYKYSHVLYRITI